MVVDLTEVVIKVGNDPQQLSADAALFFALVVRIFSSKIRIAEAFLNRDNGLVDLLRYFVAGYIFELNSLGRSRTYPVSPSFAPT